MARPRKQVIISPAKPLSEMLFVNESAVWRHFEEQELNTPQRFLANNRRLPFVPHITINNQQLVLPGWELEMVTLWGISYYLTHPASYDTGISDILTQAKANRNIITWLTNEEGPLRIEVSITDRQLSGTAVGPLETHDGKYKGRLHIPTLQRLSDEDDRTIEKEIVQVVSGAPPWEDERAEDVLLSLWLTYPQYPIEYLCMLFSMKAMIENRYSLNSISYSTPESFEQLLGEYYNKPQAVEIVYSIDPHASCGKHHYLPKQ